MTDEAQIAALLADTTSHGPDIDPEMLLGDIALADLFVRNHGHDARYVPAWRTWLFWDTTRWKRDTTGEALRRAQATVKGIYAGTALGQTQAERHALLKQAQRADQRRRMESMLALAAVHRALVLEPGQLDADPWLFNVENGCLDLRTGQRREHRMADLMTRLAPVVHDPAATCPTFERFLKRILADDAELRAFLQRAVGYSLTGSDREQAFFILHGAGTNGKSTLLSTLRRLLGDYALGVDVETLLATKRPGHGPNPDVMRLRGARFVTATEATAGRRLADALIKRLTGGDPIVGRDLYQPGAEEFIATLKLFLGVNFLPLITDTTFAMWRRVLLLPFTVTIAKAEQDGDLPAKLDAERSGILRWAIEGCLSWQQRGLGAPATVARATAKYQAEQDPLGAFLTVCCRIDPVAAAPADPLYQGYVKWAEESDEDPMTATAFGRALTGRGFHPNKTKHGRYRLGLRLLEPGENPEKPDTNPSPDIAKADDGQGPVRGLASVTGCDGLVPIVTTARALGGFIEKPDTNPEPVTHPSPEADLTSDMFDPPESSRLPW